MKKVLIVICISAFLASCGGGDTKSTDVKTDSSTTVTSDSSKMSTPADTTTHVMKDSTVKTDSSKK